MSSSGAGSQSSSQSSRPLTATERSDVFGGGIRNIGDVLGITTPKYGGFLANATPEQLQWWKQYYPKIVEASRTDTPDFSQYTTYDAPAFKMAGYTPGEAQTFGNYDELEQSILKSRTAPLEQAWKQARSDINQEASDRGLWASGVPVAAEERAYREDFQPAYQQAAAEAATQRYGLQADELAKLNQYALTRGQMSQEAANAENAFNAEQAQAQLAAKRWLPEYLQGTYNGTGGSVSSGGSSGVNFTI